MRAYSRQRQHRVSLNGRWVSPGGKTLSSEDERFNQTSYKEFALKPGLGTVFVIFLEMPELQQRLKSLESQLNLPAFAIKLHDCLGTRSHQGGQHNDVACGGFRLNLAVFGFLFNLLLRGSRLCNGLLVGEHAYRYTPFVIFCPSWPVTGLPDTERAQFGQHIECLTLIVTQRQIGQVHAQHHVSLMFNDVTQAAPVGKSAISHNHITRIYGKVSQALAHFSLRDMHFVTAQSVQIGHSAVAKSNQ